MPIIIGLFLAFPYLFNVDLPEMEIGNLPFENSQFITIDGVDLHYRLWEPKGENANGNVVLIHGFGGSTFSWRYTAPFLAANNFRVLAIDLPAFGYSDRNHVEKNKNISRSELCWDLMEKIDSTKKWIVVGHSMGGAIANYMTNTQAEKTQALIMVNPAEFSSKNNLSASLFNQFFKFPPTLRWIEFLGKNQMIKEKNIEKLLVKSYGRQPSKEEIDGYFKALNIKGTQSAIINGFVYAKKAENYELENFEKFNTLLIIGDKDEVVPPNIGKKISEKIPSSKLLQIENAGHCPMETHVEEFNNILLEFIEQEIEKTSLLN